jgi:molybdate transport system regulatory protein
MQRPAPDTLTSQSGPTERKSQRREIFVTDFISLIELLRDCTNKRQEAVAGEQHFVKKAPNACSENSYRFGFWRGDRAGQDRIPRKLERAGSIRAAATLMKMSYRRAWMLLEALERAFAKPLLATATGGSNGCGVSLIPRGRKVVGEYRALERAAIKTGCRGLRKLELLAKR